LDDVIICYCSSVAGAASARCLNMLLVLHSGVALPVAHYSSTDYAMLKVEHMHHDGERAVVAPE